MWKTLQPDARWFRQKPKVSSFDSQTVRERSGKAPQAQPREMEGKRRRQRRTGVRGGVKERKPGKGILKAWKPQNARQAGSGACHVCNQHFVTIPQDLGHRQKCRQTDIHAPRQKGSAVSMETCRQTGRADREKQASALKLLSYWQLSVSKTIIWIRKH